jgi:hypothetical protein
MARFRGPSRSFVLKAGLITALLGSTFLMGGCSHTAGGALLGACVGGLIGGDAESAAVGAAVGAGVGAVIDAEAARSRECCPYCGRVHDASP